MEDGSVEGSVEVLGWMSGVPGILGALGLILYVGSYLALQLGLIRGDGWAFPALNLAAALSLILSLAEAFNLFAMVVQIVWVVISTIGLIRLYLIYRYLRFTDDERGAVARLRPPAPPAPSRPPSRHRLPTDPCSAGAPRGHSPLTTGVGNDPDNRQSAVLGRRCRPGGGAVRDRGIG
jgi:hypothetical protein